MDAFNIVGASVRDTGSTLPYHSPLPSAHTLRRASIEHRPSGKTVLSRERSRFPVQGSYSMTPPASHHQRQSHRPPYGSSSSSSSKNSSRSSGSLDDFIKDDRNLYYHPHHHQYVHQQARLETNTPPILPHPAQFDARGQARRAQPNHSYRWSPRRSTSASLDGATRAKFKKSAVGAVARCKSHVCSVSLALTRYPIPHICPIRT